MAFTDNTLTSRQAVMMRRPHQISEDSEHPSPHINSPYESELFDLEDSIVGHVDLRQNLAVVRTYLTISQELLEAISYLRQEGVLWNATTAHFRDPSIKIPRREHREALMLVQPALFSTPPSDLFDLICQYRFQSNWQHTGIVERLVQVPESQEMGKTAPKGQVYACPSIGCGRTYTKAGHAKKHVAKTHPDYLRYNSGYDPAQNMIPEASDESISSTSQIEQRRSRSVPNRKRPRRSTLAHADQHSNFLQEVLDHSSTLPPVSFAQSPFTFTGLLMEPSPQPVASQLLHYSNPETVRIQTRTSSEGLGSKRRRESLSPNADVLGSSSTIRRSRQPIRRHSKRLSSRPDNYQFWQLQ